METITVNGQIYYSHPQEQPIEYNLTEDSTFIEVGKIYLFRTVTMIYLGRVKCMLKHELLLEECAWIPETARWAETVAEGKFNEVEPYKRDVILFKGAILDITEMAATCMVQK
jgi:hypothetical protein